MQFSLSGVDTTPPQLNLVSMLTDTIAVPGRIYYEMEIEDVQSGLDSVLGFAPLCSQTKMNCMQPFL